MQDLVTSGMVKTGPVKRVFTIGDRIFEQDYTGLMGIVNITNDSFSDGGQSTSKLLNLCKEFEKNNFSVIDIGGCSTRPSASKTADNEATVDVVRLVKEQCPKMTLSIDTFNYQTVKKVISYVSMINDVSGGSKEILEILTSFDKPISLCVMQMCEGIEGYAGLSSRHHCDFSQKSLSKIEHYHEDMKQIIKNCLKAGIYKFQLWIDYGVGFGKDAVDSWKLLGKSKKAFQNSLKANYQDVYVSSEYPILCGLSRKGYLVKLAGGSEVVDTQERDLLTAIAVAEAVKGGRTSLIRVHNPSISKALQLSLAINSI